MFDMELQCILRLIIAAICGALIGCERKNRAKEAGVRTHCVVACGAALMMVISKYGFADQAIGDLGMRGADGARIAAQVVSGIGFLGAGMIFVHKNTITGLTTAAGIWATSGVGMAIGAGMYLIGIAATAIILLIQIVLHLSPRRSTRQAEANEKEEAEEDDELPPFTQGELIEIRPTGELDENGKEIYTARITLPQEMDGK